LQDEPTPAATPGVDFPQAVTTDEALPAINGMSQGYQPNPPADSRAGRGPARPAPLPPAPPTDYMNAVPQKPNRRITSPTGGVQVTLEGGGSWSDLARQDATLPTDANTVGDGKPEGSGGMFGFLKGKKGRNNSPRPKERGVLGKEGARVVIG
jgi:serine/threonine kinase 32